METIESLVEQGAVEPAAKLVKNIVDLWTFKRALAKRAYMKIAKFWRCAGCGETIAHDESLCGKCSGQLLANKCVWGDDHA